jgi:uncharacterized membrane protein
VIVLLAVLLAAAWVSLLVVAPLLPGWAGAILYGIGSLICHQIPERSFYLSGFQLPVCTRCLGIYTGAAAGAAFVLIRRRSGETLFPAASATRRWLAVAAAAPTIVTVALEAAGMWYPSNFTRALAGFALGGILAFVVVGALATLHYGECVPPRPTVPKPPQRSI